ncbi:hypothetical protein CTI12_AA193580 [Artemisia annua]|uniref:Uncharacterized protein n=1 Tax=Artemisia annua TaxID=35608 RepID=A0A2U1MZJ0_ARTAN|nr:hypothetical protein CTI12_AA193580 [Artemisia annua]
MSQEITPELKDTICDRCHCVDQKFLHRVWFEGKDQKFCTSCVLFSHPQSFCPTCLIPYNGVTPNISRCNKCHSYSHGICMSTNGSPVGAASMCSTCINPDGLIFMSKDIKNKGKDGFSKGIDVNAAHLLFAAAKIAHTSISAAHYEFAKDADIMVAKAIKAKKNATEYVKKCTKIETGGPSLLDDLTNGEKGTSFETLVEAGRLQKLSIHGAACNGRKRKAVLGIDLNK